MKTIPTIVALIPARSGSNRLPDKNIRILNGNPLIAYSISAAKLSGIFSDIIVSTDTEQYAEIAQKYGAEVPFLRPLDISDNLSPDIEWLEFTLNRLREKGRIYDCFSILRPTNPFRLPETIQRAWQDFLNEEGVDSLRAVELCSQHPGKMWVVNGKRMNPLLPCKNTKQPWHSSAYQSLPEIYVQNASLEIAWSRVVFNDHTITGDVIMPFFTQGYEGFDINKPYDWELAEKLIKERKAVLPEVKK